MVERPTSLEFFFDPMCPYAYQTSLWIRAVRDQIDLEIDWRFFSLEEINREDGKKHPWERDWSYGWSQMRIGALLRRRGQEHVDRWYAAVGAAFHEQAVPTHEPDVHRELLEQLGYGGGLLDEAMRDATTSDEVRADHDHVVREHGAYGVPVLVLPGGYAQFGPVMVPAVVDERAVPLLDAVLALEAFPEVFELNHPKRPEDLRAIAAAFEPYLRARSWRTIMNPAP